MPSSIPQLASRSRYISLIVAALLACFAVTLAVLPSRSAEAVSAGDPTGKMDVSRRNSGPIGNNPLMSLLNPGNPFVVDVTAAWGFEGVTTTGTGTTPPVITGSTAADSGTLTAGSAFTAFHTNASTVWSNPAGNASVRAVSSEHWGVGDYYQFLFSTTGYAAISVTWDQTGSATGPRDFKVQYSTNGTTFTNASGTNSTYVLTTQAWSSGGSPFAASRRTLDLSTVTALENQSTVYIRLVDNSTTAINGGTVATTGTGRVDNFTVNGTAATGTQSSTTALTSSLNPSNVGNSVTFTATVSGSSGTPTGSVTFKDGASTLGTGALSAGVATFTTSSLTVGTHSITAVYGGNSTYNGSTSSAVSQQVVSPLASSSTALTSSLNPSNVGDSVTFTATVSGSSGTPTGSVTFKDGASTLGVGTLSSGVATFSTSSLTAGTHSITAVYGGDSTYNGSTSSAVSQQVNAAPPGVPGTVVISQVYGGGGNGSATYQNDYVELFNRSAATVSVTGWSVQYASATGTGNFSGNVASLSGSILPGQYYLVKLASGGASGVALPTEQASQTGINMSGTDGKVVLADTATGLACNGGSTTCSAANLAHIMDLVGYGSANFFEGSAAPGLSNNASAIFRAGGGCTDTDNNGSDFNVATTNPRNAASPLNTCAVPTPTPTPSPVPSPTAPPPPAPFNSAIKISQVYGGGGNSGSTYRNDFIELYNSGSLPVDITGWSVQYTNATSDFAATITQSSGTTPLVTVIPAGSIVQPGHYFLIQESQGAGGTTTNPGADLTGGILVGSTAGKVALVASSSVLVGGSAGNCPTDPNIVDFVGYNPTATCSETSPTAPLTNTLAAIRKNNGCTDANNNSNDFLIDGPIPRNSLSPVHGCGGDATQISGTGIATPDYLLPSSNTLLTVKVSPATIPPSTGINVSANLTSIGGSASQQFYDDATHGDQFAGDNTFSFQITVGPFITTGLKSMLATITDEQTRSTAEAITLTVQSPTCGVERWSVKTGSDPDASQVDINTPVPTTIAALRSLTPPVSPPDNARFGPAEKTVYEVTATMTFYKLEGDVDYHIILQDASGNTLITEIPCPCCVAVSSPFTAGIAHARQQFDSRLTATNFFQAVSIPVRVTGVGFFDFIHGQNGVAPNGIELHPLLDITFLDSTTTTVSSGSNPSQYGQSVVFTTTVTSAGPNTPSGTVTFSDSATVISSAPLNGSGQAFFNTTSLSVGSHSITASYPGDSDTLPSTSTVLTQVVNKADQFITFNALAGKTFGDPDFSVSAPASSGLPVSFSVFSGPATISGNTVHITGAGTVTIRASQAGDSNYNPAPDVDQSFEVAKADQLISFAPLGNKTYGDAPFVVSATGGASGNPVTFTANGNCTSGGTNGSTITITGAGSCTVTAAQTGNSNYNPAADVPRSFTIDQATATINVNGYTGTYDANAHGATGSATGVNSEDLSSLLNLGASFTDVPGGTAHWTFAGNANYAPAAGDASITIAKASSTTVVSCPASVTYTGAALTPCSVAVTGVNLNLTPAANYTNNTNAGTATASYTYAGDSNHDGSSDSKNFEITKASSTTTVTCPASQTYTGAALTPCSVTVTGANLSLTPAADYLNNTNVGTATASYSYAGDANHDGSGDSKNFEITKASSTTTVTCPTSQTYTGVALTPCSVSVTGANLSLSPTENYANNTNAGTATASYTYAGDANHDGSSDSKNFEITKASSTTTVTCPASQTYTGVALTPCSVTVTGANLSLTPAANYLNNTNVGTATASYSYAGDANHDGSSDSKNFEITKASSTTTVTCPASETYTGAALTPCSVTVTGANLSLTPAADYLNNTNVDTATASYSYAGDANHDGSSDSKNFEITKANATINVTPYNVTYDGNPHTATGTATGVNGESLSGLDLSGTTHTNAGTYNGDGWAFIDVTGNYNNTSGTVNDNIHQASASITVNGYSGVYDGSAHGATGSATGVNGEDLSSLLNLGATFTNVPGGTAHWTFAGNTNYAPASGDASVTITKATPLITWNNPADITYGTALSSTQLNATANVAGSFNYTPASGTVLSAGSGQTLLASFTPTDTTNYNATSKSVMINVLKATPSFSNLSSPTIVNGTATTNLSGKITFGSFIPTGSVSITLNSVTQSAAIQAGGNFSSVFATGSLAAGAYSIAYSYAGDGNFNSASGSGTLTVGYGVVALYDQTKVHQSGSTIPIKLKIVDSNGNNLSSANTAVTAVGIALISTSVYGPVEAAGNSNPDNNFRFDSGSYIFNLKTTGLSTGVYNLYFTVGADPTLHTVQFQIK